jgi:3-mercaptopropionate dioxygenase
MRPSISATSSSPAFASFVSDAESLIDDPFAIADRLAALLAQEGWLAAEDQLPGVDHYRQHRLYFPASRRMSVVALVWRPGQQTPIHDHIAWCVVGVYRGVERETRYRLVDERGEQCLQVVGAVDAYPGHVEALVPPAEDIHHVAAGGDDVTISIHVYGADIEGRGTSIYRRFDDLTELAPAA